MLRVCVIDVSTPGFSLVFRVLGSVVALLVCLSYLLFCVGVGVVCVRCRDWSGPLQTQWEVVLARRRFCGASY